MVNFYFDDLRKLLVMYISLLDKTRQNYVQADGIVKLKIVNELGEEVYKSTFQIKKDMFFNTFLTKDKFSYTYDLYPTKEINVFKVAIPFDNIKKSASSRGIAYVEFETSDDIDFELDVDIYGLPLFSEEEIEQINEENYAKNKIELNQTQTKGSFMITVSSAGYYSPIPKYEWEERKEYFRVDLEVKNIGTKPEYFDPINLALLDNEGNQFEEEYEEGTLDTFQKIYPGVTKKGYILFPKLKNDTNSVRLVFELEGALWEYEIPLEERAKIKRAEGEIAEIETVMLHGEGKCDLCHDVYTLADIRTSLHKQAFEKFEGHKNFCVECHNIQETCTKCHELPLLFQ